MATISVAMIVKNEEKILERCLDSLQGIYDELIIVDTGSSDKTKEIAGKYTDKVYDFEWIDDFSKARNFSFSKCNMDYIYTADADEVLDEKNRQEFINLKQVIDPEIDIVQMYYANQLENGTVYNYDKEYRAKLYKRVRNFTFVDPVHEVVRTEPLVFDSDIEIMHKPENLHSKRDFSIYEKAIREGGISDRLRGMYARELYVSGDVDDFKKSVNYFKNELNKELTTDELKVVEAVLVKGLRLSGDVTDMLKMALHNVADGKACAEVCYELGEYYMSVGDYDEAYIWYYNACFETECVLSIKVKDEARLNEVKAKLGVE